MTLSNHCLPNETLDIQFCLSKPCLKLFRRADQIWGSDHVQSRYQVVLLGFEKLQLKDVKNSSGNEIFYKGPPRACSKDLMT